MSNEQEQKNKLVRIGSPCVQGRIERLINTVTELSVDGPCGRIYLRESRNDTLRESFKITDGIILFDEFKERPKLFLRQTAIRKTNDAPLEKTIGQHCHFGPIVAQTENRKCRRLIKA